MRLWKGLTSILFLVACAAVVGWYNQYTTTKLSDRNGNSNALSTSKRLLLLLVSLIGAAVFLATAS
jgi:hypothetical protein